MRNGMLAPHTPIEIIEINLFWFQIATLAVPMSLYLGKTVTLRKLDEDIHAEHHQQGRGHKGQVREYLEK